MNLFDDHLDEITFTDYLDGELAPDDRAQVEAHLDTCAECAAQVAEFRLLFSTLEELPELAPSRDLVPAVVAALQPTVQPVYHPQPLRWVLALQIAAVVVLSLGAGYVLLPQWMALQQTVQSALTGFDLTPVLLWAQMLWDAWVAPFQTWRGLDPVLFENLPTISLTNAAALFVVTVIGWIACNRFLLPSVSLHSPRRTP